jgi:hypothetical protein
MSGRKKQIKVQSLAWFARQTDPFQTPDLILKRLRMETSESKFLEWKMTPPIGSNVTLRTKYRIVKAIVSFANTEGGFILFGVDPKGTWIGFTESDLKETDPAALAELINGCISPELIGSNYVQLSFGGRLYPVLHVPPSPLMPHVTTKDIQEKLPDVSHVFYLNKNAVYCRYLGKSDLASPAQFARIIGYRTDFLKAELLRRVKEVNLPVLQTVSRTPSGAPTILRIATGSKDKSLPAVRITRNPSEATGLVVHEELSGALFEEINNVLDANNLLARSRPEFVFGQEIYYRIYAERQHIQPDHKKYDLLAHAGVKFYAPICYWVLRMTADEIAVLIKGILIDEKSMQNRLVCRLAILLGPKVTQWMKTYFDKRWAKYSQPPEHYFAFKKMLAKSSETDPRLVALQTSNNSEIELPSDGKRVEVLNLLAYPQQSGVFLSKVCMAVYGGDMSQRWLCRFLDIIGDLHR